MESWIPLGFHRSSQGLPLGAGESDPECQVSTSCQVPLWMCFKNPGVWRLECPEPLREVRRGTGQSATQLRKVTHGRPATPCRITCSRSPRMPLRVSRPRLGSRRLSRRSCRVACGVVAPFSRSTIGGQSRDLAACGFTCHPRRICYPRLQDLLVPGTSAASQYMAAQGR